MATLVLSTVGTILGGPVGGAIGSLVGQSIDQQIFGSARRGPRLGDLSVQTSSYGTQVPRIYGTMRVAGSIIWATDLVESTATSGAKGQPDVTYSYSISFAVALSSRPVAEIQRIWADGKLLRGEAGDFKVSTEFRFCDGRETQIADSLIASVEGSQSTPAYRGLALAVFENLELAEFGNRIPFLTFEVAADLSPPSLKSILGDASKGRVDCDVSTMIDGYAATGRSIRDAIEPLVETFAVDLVDDGERLRSPPAGDDVAVAQGELGASAEAGRVARLERAQASARLLPAVVSLTYYDPQRDYQTGQAQSGAVEQSGSEAKIELPAVLSATDARGLAENLIARKWAQRDQLTLRLPPKFLSLQPGSLVVIPSIATSWQVRRCMIESMTAVAELYPAWRTTAAISGDAGRLLTNNDVVSGEVSLALVELPDFGGNAASSPTVYLAASKPTAGWGHYPVELSCGAFATSSKTAARKSILGSTVTALGNGQSQLLDLGNEVEVQLVDHDQWLTSCDDEALADGTNLALIGDELVQFGDAESVGTGKFRLRRLLRGRVGTEWAMTSHALGDAFVMISQPTLRAIALPAWSRGSVATTSLRSANQTFGTSRIVDCRALQPPSPTNARAVIAGTGELQISWTRRSRSAWAWIDDVDVPLGESNELYSVALQGTAATVEFETSTPTLVVSAAEVAQLGSGLLVIEVRQIGDWAASVPVEISLTLA